MQRVWIGAAFAAAALCSLTATAQIKQVAVTGGQVQGVPNHGVSSFRGIPFAAPPLGELRWKAPQPVKPWDGVKQADEFGRSCMQDPNMLTMFGAPANPSEDCLYLNVWTPAKSPSDKLPVMVWIYGGGFAAGTSSIAGYDGTRLALKGVVLVSINYRVGAMGFLALPELTREGRKAPAEGSAGNYGLQDQIAGLQWVKQNIAKFGGDPSRVTIFGESAGGISVSMLTASPAAKGLFHRVISESGGSFAPLKHANEGGQNVPPLKVAEAHGQAFLKKLGVSNLKAARALSAEAIQNAQGRGLSGDFWPVADGVVLIGDQYELYQAGKFSDTPILIGTNSDEGGLFVPRHGCAGGFRGADPGGLRREGGNGARRVSACQRGRGDDGHEEHLPRFGFRLAHVGVGDAPVAEGKEQGVRVLLRSPHAASAERRRPRVGDRVRVRQPGWPRWRAGRIGGSASSRGHVHVQTPEQLLGELRDDRRSEWRGIASRGRPSAQRRSR